MTLPVIDRDGRSATAAAEGNAALASGDTLLARKHFEEAGKLLEKKIAGTRKTTEKHLLLFLAASQYFHGGHYQTALKLARRVEEGHLTSDARHLFPKFFHDVKARAAPDYKQSVRQELMRLVTGEDDDGVLALLREHPYLLPREAMAFLRACACEKKKNYRAAAAFYADAVRWSPNDPTLIFTAAALPLTLPGQGRLDEAWEYVQFQLSAIPHAATYAIASLVCFHRASQAEGGDCREIYKEQIGFFEKARDAFKTMPPEQANDRDCRSFMEWAHEAAALALVRLGNQTRAKDLCNQAIKFAPNTSSPWVVRGIVTYPSDEAVEDFERAVTLGERSYFPNYFLAHQMLAKGSYQAALPLCEKALNAAAKANDRVRSSIYGWLAICEGMLGADVDHVEQLFQKARELDPHNSDVEHNYHLFFKSRKGETVDVSVNWRWGSFEGQADQFLWDRERSIKEEFQHVDQMKRGLQIAGR